MFGLWFSIIGLLFGVLCSMKAKEKDRSQKEWFVMGFLFSFLAFAILQLLPTLDADDNETDLRNDREFVSL